MAVIVWSIFIHSDLFAASSDTIFHQMLTTTMFENFIAGRPTPALFLKRTAPQLRSHPADYDIYDTKYL